MEVSFSKPYRQSGELRIDAFVEGKPSGIVLRKSPGTGKWDAMCEGYFRVRERRNPVFAYQYFAWEMVLKEGKEYITEWLKSGKLYLKEYRVLTPRFEDLTPIEFVGVEK